MRAPRSVLPREVPGECGSGPEGHTGHGSSNSSRISSARASGDRRFRPGLFFATRPSTPSRLKAEMVFLTALPGELRCLSPLLPGGADEEHANDETPAVRFPVSRPPRRLEIA